MLRVTPRLILIACLTAVYSGWILVAVFFNYTGTDQFSSSLNNAVRNFVFWALLLFVGIRLARTDGLYRFGKIFLWACALVAAVSIMQTASGGRLLRNDEQSVAYLSVFQPLGDKLIERRILSDANVNVSEGVRVIALGPVAFYRAPGTFEGAPIVLCSAAVAVFALLTYRRDSRKLLLLFLLLTCGFLAAFTRTSIIVFVAVIATISLLRFRALLSPRLLFGFAAAFVIALFTVMLVPFLNRAAAALIDGFVGSRSFEVASLNGRLGLWQYVGDQVVQHPIFGSTEPITLLRAGWGTNDDPASDITAHNGYFEVAYRYGVAPGLVLLTLYAFCLWRSFRLWLSTGVEPGQRVMIFALFSALLAAFAMNMTGSFFMASGVAALLWIPCGYLATLRVPRRRRYASVQGVVHERDQSRDRLLSISQPAA